MATVSRSILYAVLFQVGAILPLYSQESPTVEQYEMTVYSGKNDKIGKGYLTKTSERHIYLLPKKGEPMWIKVDDIFKLEFKSENSKKKREYLIVGNPAMYTRLRDAIDSYRRQEYSLDPSYRPPVSVSGIPYRIHLVLTKW